MGFATVNERYSAAEIASFYETGHWRPETIVDIAEQQAGRTPHKIFVTDSTKSLTYRELVDSAGRLALGLRRLGVGPGDRISVQIPSWAEFTQIALAAGRIGAITVPIMPIYRRDDVGFVLGNAGVRSRSRPARTRGSTTRPCTTHCGPNCPNYATSSSRGGAGRRRAEPGLAVRSTSSPIRTSWG